MRLYNGVRLLDAPSPANVRRLDHGCLPMIHSMQARGIRVDLPYLKAREIEFKDLQAGIEFDLFESVGTGYQDFDGKIHKPFNIGSPDQVARLLFKHLQVQGRDKLQKTSSESRESTSDDVLARYKGTHPAVGYVLAWRELGKLLGTYIEPLQAWADADSRVHTEFSVTTAATGRLSSKRPNLQNIPTRSRLGKLIRNAFIASPGNLLVSCDLSQIEMRWAAHLSQDPTMMGVFFRDEDIHDRTACEIFGRDLEYVTKLKKGAKSGEISTFDLAVYKYFIQFERLPAKTLGFGILYGQTAQGLRESILTSADPEWSAEEREKFDARWSLEECEKLITRWYAVYYMIRKWMDLQFYRACRWGRTWDAFGRIRLVPEVFSVHKRVKAEGLRKAGNHAIQASATGTVKLAMAELMPVSQFFDTCGVCWPLLQIHDELITEVDRAQAKDWADESRQVLELSCPLSVPVRSSSDIAERWGDLK
jgi:DNA polymerase I